MNNKKGKGSKTPSISSNMVDFIADEAASGASLNKIPSTIKNALKSFFPYEPSQKTGEIVASLIVESIKNIQKIQKEKGFKITTHYDFKIVCLDGASENTGKYNGLFQYWEKYRRKEFDTLKLDIPYVSSILIECSDHLLSLLIPNYEKMILNDESLSILHQNKSTTKHIQSLQAISNYLHSDIVFKNTFKNQYPNETFIPQTNSGREYLSYMTQSNFIIQFENIVFKRINEIKQNNLYEKDQKAAFEYISTSEMK